MLGYADDELENAFDTWESRVHPDDIKQAKDHINNYLSGKTSNFGVELRLQHKNGHWVDILTRGFAIRDKSNEDYVRFIGTHIDITERKHAEAELKKHREDLEELIKQRTRDIEKKNFKLEKSEKALRYLLADVNEISDDLKKSNQKLEQAREQAEVASQAKSEFLANMSHEIRTPMNAILGFTHLMKQADPSSKQEKQLTKIDNAAGHLLSIINNILDISKIEAGKLVLEQTDFHLNAIFDHVKSLLSEQAQLKNLCIEIETDSVPLWLRGDSTRIRQALLNYATNAIKFTEQGSIFLRALKLEENDDEVLIRFEVRDTGIGIEPSKQSDLFKAFKQADSSTTRQYGGTGLGLTITRHIAQLMGGESGVKSEMGVGSTFWFTARLHHGHGVMTNLSSNKEAQLD